MSRIIAHGATMYCSLGTGKSNLAVTSQAFRRVADTLIGTEGGNKGMVNVSSFGVYKCSSPDPPCTLQLQGRQQATKKDSINGMKKLMEQSFCMYAKGGRISFVDIGSNSFVESEQHVHKILSVCMQFLSLSKSPFTCPEQRSEKPSRISRFV